VRQERVGERLFIIKITKMNIAIIGTGSVGSSLALAFKKAGHNVVLGVRNPQAMFKGKDLAIEHAISFYNIEKAVEMTDVIAICAPGDAAHEVAKQLGNVAGKVIIDTMNALFKKPGNYSNTADAVLANCNCTDVVKCFNTTGFENMADPVYNGTAIDMFVAGSSIKAKQIAIRLAKDIGFAEVYDFGGNDKFDLIEQFALCWVNLAIIQKQGRNLAFKILRRNIT
jgi:predicted dinucleotide-binding enzyme